MLSDKLKKKKKNSELTVFNAKNNMNAIAVDANNLQQNLQLSRQASQCSFNNNQFEFYQEVEQNHQYQSQHQQQQQLHQHRISIANSNYYLAEGVNTFSLPLNNNREVRPLETTVNRNTVNELIETFNDSLDLSNIDKIPLPQIILSDFSNNQSTPLTTSLLFTRQSIKTLSEYPSEIASPSPSCNSSFLSIGTASTTH